MPRHTNRGAAPGTYTSGGVRCTMDAPFKQGANKGSQANLSGTFDHPRSGGDNGLPTRVTDRMGGPKAGPKASRRDALGTVLTKGSSTQRR